MNITIYLLISLIVSTTTFLSICRRTDKRKTTMIKMIISAVVGVLWPIYGILALVVYYIGLRTISSIIFK